MVIATSASIEVVSRESFAWRLEGMRNDKSSSSTSSLLSSSSASSSSSTVACVNCHKQRGDGRNGPRGGSVAGGNGNSFGKRKPTGRHKSKNTHVCCTGSNNNSNGNGRGRKKSQNHHQPANASVVTSAGKGAITSSSPIVVNIRDSLLRSRKLQSNGNKFRQSSLDADSDASSTRSTDEDVWATSRSSNSHAAGSMATSSSAGRANRHDRSSNINRRRDEDEQFCDEASSTSVSEELSSSPEIVSFLHNHYNHHSHQSTRSRLRSSRSDRYKKYTRGSHNNNSNRGNGNHDRGFSSSKSHHYYGGLYPSFYHQSKAGDSMLPLSSSMSSTPSSRKHWTAIISEIEKSHPKEHTKDTDVNLAGFASATAKHYYSNLLNNYNINHDNCPCALIKTDEALNNRPCSGIRNGCKDVEVKKRNVAECENVDLICNDLFTSNEKMSEESTDESDSSDKASVLSSSDAYSDDSGGIGAPSICHTRNAKKFVRKFSSDQLEDLVEYTAGAPLVQYDCHPTQCTTCMNAISSYPYSYSYYDAYESNQGSQFLYDLHAHHQMYQHHTHHHQFTHHHNHHLQRFHQNRHRQYFYNHRMPYLYNSQHPHHFPNHQHLRQYRYLYPVQQNNHWIIERPSGTRDKLSATCSSTDGGVDDAISIEGNVSNHDENDTGVKAFVSSSRSSLSSSSSSLLSTPPRSPSLPPSPPAMITTSSNTVVTICSKSSGKFFSSSAPLLSLSKKNEEEEKQERGNEDDGDKESKSTTHQFENQNTLRQSGDSNCVSGVEDVGTSNQTDVTLTSSSKEYQNTSIATKSSDKTEISIEPQRQTISTTTTSAEDNNNNNDYHQASPSSSEECKDCNFANSVFMDLSGLDVSFSVHYPGDPAHLCLTSGGSSSSSSNQNTGNLMPFFSPSVSFDYNHPRKGNKGASPSLLYPSPMPMYPSLSSSRACRPSKKDIHNKLYSNKNRVPLGLTSSFSSSLSSSADDNESDPHSYELVTPSNRPWITTGQADPDVPAAVFTVMCYNVLSDKLCTKQMYGYCPTWALAWDYRKKGIMSDIISGNADIITLQEVETEQYYGLFLPELMKRGYEGVFLPKSRVRTMNSDKEKMSVDGCAIFYKKTKFEKVNEHHVEFSQLATKDGASNTDSDMINRVSTKDNIAIVAMLRTKPAAYEGSPVPAPKGLSQMLMVSTAHIHWDPQLPDVKLVQTIMLVEELRKFIKEASVQFRPNAPPPSVDSSDMCSSLPLILCGDFNSLPDSGVFEFLSKGKLNTRHRDFDGQNYKAFMKDRNENGILNHNFKLTSAYKDVIPFTNYTFDFKGVIDYVFYSGQHFKLHGVMGLQDEEWFRVNKIVGCPHPFVPSDHFPLFAEFSLPAKPSQKPSSAAPR